MKKYILIFFFLSLPISAIAQDMSSFEVLPTETSARILTNMAADLAECSAFYQIVSECMNNTQAGSGDKLEQVSTSELREAAIMQSMSTAMTLWEAGKDVDVDKLTETSAKAVFIWYERDKQEMLDEILACSNISLLTIKFMEICNEYLNNPDVLREKWTKEFTESHDG